MFAQSLPQFDVRTYGAVCNAVTDDRAALQAALNAVPSSGGEVLIPCKMAVGGNGVSVDGKSNLVIRSTVAGAGFKALSRPSQRAGGFGPILFILRQCTDCRIEDLDFDGNGVATSLVGLDRCTRTIVTGNTIRNASTNFSGGGLSATGNRNNQYLNNIVRDIAYGVYEGPRGMWIGNAAGVEHEYFPIIDGNTVQRTGWTGIATHAVGATIRGNLVEFTGCAGTKLVPPAGIAGENLIENNTFRRNDCHGIQIEKGFSMTIRNNILEENKMSGLFILNGFANSSASHNTVRDNNFDKIGGWQSGIYIHHANNATIENNQIYDTRTGSARSQDNAITVNTTSPGGIRDLRLRNNLCSNHSFHGISVQNNGSGTLDGVELSGNSCTGNQYYGMHIYEKASGALRNITAADNVLSYNGSGSIYDNSLQKVQPGTTSTAPDVTPPSVWVTSPSSGAQISGSVSVNASASDDVGVTSVWYHLDGQDIGSATTSPYAITLNTAQYANGLYTLTAFAKDAANNTNSASISFTISNSTTTTAPPASGDQPFVTAYTVGTTVTGGYTGWAGLRLRTGGSAVTVTALGRWKLSNNTLTHTLKIVDAATGQNVPGASVEISLSSGAADQFIYGSLPSPAILEANKLYYLVSSESVDRQRGDFFHDYINSDLTTTGVGSVEGGVFWDGRRWQPQGTANQSVGPMSLRHW